MSTSCTCGILHCKGLRVRAVPSVPSATDLPSPPKSPIHHGPEGHVRHHASNHSHHSHHSGILTRWCYMVLRSLLLDPLEEIWETEGAGSEIVATGHWLLAGEWASLLVN